MKHSNQQHTLAVIGFTLWALFAVAGLAQAHAYTYACPGSGVLVSHYRDNVILQQCQMMRMLAKL